MFMTLQSPLGAKSSLRPSRLGGEQNTAETRRAQRKPCALESAKQWGVSWCGVTRCRRTIEVSDRRRQERWRARGALELPPGLERTSGAAVRSTDWFGDPNVHYLKTLLLSRTRREGRPARDNPNSNSLRVLGVRRQTHSGHPRLTRSNPPNDRTERQPPTGTVERTRRVRTAARRRAEKRGGCSLQ
jgi:hypothetical protein